MTADGNVILVNQADHSSATAGKADYDRPSDLFTLTEDPVWWNDRMEVRGDTLPDAAPSNRSITPRAMPGSSSASPAPPAVHPLRPSMAFRFRRRHPSRARSVPKPISPPFAAMSSARLFDGETTPGHVDLPNSSSFTSSPAARNPATRSSSSSPARTSTPKPPRTPAASSKQFPAACSPPTAPPPTAFGRPSWPRTTPSSNPPAPAHAVSTTTNHRRHRHRLFFSRHQPA